MINLSAESALSFMNTTKVWIRFSLSYVQDDIKETINNSNYFVIDKNRTINSKIFGCLGYVFLGIFSSFVVFGIFFVRFAITNADSAKRAFVLKVNQEVSDVNTINLTEDKRNEVLQNFGLPGKMLGNILGSIGAMSIASEYYFEYVFKSIMLVAFYEAPPEIKQQVILPTAKNKRLFEGLPGAFFGGIIGGVSFVVVISLSNPLIF